MPAGVGEKADSCAGKHHWLLIAKLPDRACMFTSWQPQITMAQLLSCEMQQDETMLVRMDGSIEPGNEESVNQQGDDP